MKTNLFSITPYYQYRQNINSVKYSPCFTSSSINTSSGDTLELSTVPNSDSDGLFDSVNFLAKRLMGSCKKQKIHTKEQNIKQREPEPKKELHNLYPDSDKEDLEKLRNALHKRAHKIETMTLTENTRIKVYDKKEDYYLRGAGGQPTEYKIYHGTRSGSNSGFYAERLSDNSLYYIKTQNGNQNIREYVASQFYKAAGIDVPEVELLNASNDAKSTYNPSNYWIRSKIVTDLKDAYSNPESAYEGFAVDAWLANWDAVVTGNTFVKDGHAVRLDFGGALDYRAMGKKKLLGNKVTEISTLLDSYINGESAYIYKNMQREDLINSLKRVQSVTAEDFNKIYKACGEYVNVEIFSTLQNRQKYLGFILDSAEEIPMKKDEKILDYVKRLESDVNKKYGKEIDKFDNDQEKRERILEKAEEQRDSVCSNEDLEQLWSVKTNYCRSINQVCARGDADGDYRVEPLDKAMKKVKLPENAVLYRAEKLSIDSRLNEKYADILPELSKGICSEGDLPSMDELINKIYKEGKVVEEKQFISTSLNQNVANAFLTDKAILYKFNAPKGLKATTLEHVPEKVISEDDRKNGLLGKCNSGEIEGTEEEIFVARGFKYKMKNLTFEDGHYVIECDIL